jgi:5-hydroxyisourate hydrolase-like protein (transthyretin family)
LLIGGAVLFGVGIPFTGSGDSNTISGTVYADGDPAADQTVELINKSSDNLLDTDTTDEDGEFVFNTSEFSGQYIVSVEGYQSKEVTDGETNLEFGDPPGLFSGLPIIGSSDNTGEADESDQNGSNNGNQTSDTTDSSDENQTTEDPTSGGSSGQVIPYITGFVNDSSTGENIDQATVTISEDGEEIADTSTNETGKYRVENVDIPLEEGQNIEDITLQFEFNAEGYERLESDRPLDLGSPLEGFKFSRQLEQQ